MDRVNVTLLNLAWPSGENVAMGPGWLRIYLGAAPRGWSKTVAMLNEGHRRTGAAPMWWSA
ncbi:MAG: hypothetical protein R2719_04420 [Micropruina sp.]